MSKMNDIFQVDYLPDEKKIKINLPEEVWKSDLISRKALLQKLEGKNSYSVNTATTEQIMKSYAYADCICIIEHEPTAYDVDKVVEQLQQMKTRYFLTIANTGNETLDKIYEDVGNSIDKAIEIVKGAVKDE